MSCAQSVNIPLSEDLSACATGRSSSVPSCVSSTVWMFVLSFRLYTILLSNPQSELSSSMIEHDESTTAAAGSISRQYLLLITLLYIYDIVVVNNLMLRNNRSMSVSLEAKRNNRVREEICFSAGRGRDAHAPRGCA